MFYLTKNADKELELHSTDDECLKPICTFVHEGWAETIKSMLNSYTESSGTQGEGDVK